MWLAERENRASLLDPRAVSRTYLCFNSSEDVQRLLSGKRICCPGKLSNRSQPFKPGHKFWCARATPDLYPHAYMHVQIRGCVWLLAFIHIHKSGTCKGARVLLKVSPARTKMRVGGDFCLQPRVWQGLNQLCLYLTHEHWGRRIWLTGADWRKNPREGHSPQAHWGRIVLKAGAFLPEHAQDQSYKKDDITEWMERSRG